MSKLLTLLSLAAGLASGETKLPREIQDLIDQSAAAPPELAADILLRLVEAGKIPDKKIKTEALEQAFVLAGSARFPMRMIGATVEGGNMDSDVGVRWRALENGLDSLSLRCSVIRAMLTVDRKHALELFRSMPPVTIPARSCSDAMVERVDGFYETLALLVNQAFSATEKSDGKHLQFAETYIQAISAPAQLEPAAKMILDLKLDGKRLSPLLSAYSSILHDLSADDRGFSSSMTPELLEALVWLVRDSEAKGVSNPGLVDAFRVYYVRHMRAARCEDSEDLKETGPLLQHVGELHPAKVEGHATVYDFWSKRETEKLLAGIKHLNLAKPEQRGKLSWQVEARDYLNQVQSWNKDHDETEENYFHEVCYIYHPLLEIVPEGELRDSVLESYISFLKQSRMERDNPPEWYFEVRQLLEPEREKVWRTVQGKGELVMSMYVELDGLTGAKRR
jgi:hypothetical protein